MCWCSQYTADCSHNGGLLKFVPKLPSTISRLGFSFNNLTHLHSDFFSNVTQLSSINLTGNGLSSIDQHAFRGLRNLTNITLDNNNLDFDSVRPVLNVSSLVRLQMCNNYNATYIPENIFLEFSLPHLSDLVIAASDLRVLNMSVFKPLKKLVSLDVGDNDIHSIVPDSLQSLNNLFLNDNNIGKDFIQTCSNIKKSLFPMLRYLRLRDSISVQMFDQCPKLSFLQLDDNNFSNVTDAKLQQLFHRIPMLTTVYLGNSRIKTITSDTFKGIPHVQELSLYSNAIEDLPDGVFDHLVNLTILRVDNNRLSEIRETTFSGSTRQRLRQLDLSNNPYACTCSLRWFRSWLMDESEKFLKFPTGYVCSPFLSSSSKQVRTTAVMANVSEGGKYSSEWSDFPERKSQPISRHFQQVYHHQYHQPPVLTLTETSVSDSRGHSTVYLCDFLLSDQACLLSQSTSLLTAVLAAVLVVFMLTFLVLYKYRWHIRLALYEAFRGNPQRRRRQPEREYEYDVFVSYANEDVDWVRQELIPTLEGRHGLRLCVHQRDFPVGGNIIDNISTCVHASKRVLFVLSPHFARSRWCQFELVFCQNYVMERDDVLVLTLLAPISSRDMTDAISAMFKTTTYLAWGEEDDARKAFWGRLVLAFHDIVPRQVA
ncbi:toll-like receptor 6 [Pomacea canaliculata]|uniref:toll-like receptor 6 n=1 Tax=Pomacea canaliculata TaxID=400727 RepID=UPI000D72A1AF|nr:toll-like receptor 6 [Pomacea canaliculata]